jgi:GTP-binding protein Era
MSSEIKRSGYVALVGRPNVGKSTLMNRILGQKLSITSRRPQTTRHRILGIHTHDDVQTVYVDTPGIHRSRNTAMNRYMNRAATTTLNDVDVVLFVVEGTRWTDEDDDVLARLAELSIPVVVAINKVDLVKDKSELLPVMQKLGEKLGTEKLIPLSAENGENVSALQTVIESLLPEGMQFYPDDQITDRSERFIAAEIIREKLTRQLGKELPYALTVEIQEFKREKELLNIAAIVFVERPGQKAIVIGKNGSMLKKIGKQARLDMEAYFDMHVYLNLWVKIREGWSDDERALRSLGYSDEL